MKKVIGLNSAGVMLAAEELQQHQEQDKKIARQAVHNPKILSHLQGFHNSQAVEK